MPDIQTPAAPPRLDPDRLRAVRRARGISRDQLAVAARISSRTVARTERGETKPQPVVVAALAAALGVEIEALTCDDPAAAGEAVRDRREVADAPAV